MSEAKPEFVQECEPLALERGRPAMYMLWPHDRPTPQVPTLAAGFRLRILAPEHLDQARQTVEIDGALSHTQWSRFRDQILPDGLFVVEEQQSSTWVGTVSAIHNPDATRFYFPGGGELGYLVVAPQHRNRGLGSALVYAAVERLRRGGYHHIFLGVQGWRLAAIRCYVHAGLQPFLHNPELGLRWKAIFQVLGLEADEAAWPTRLPSPTS
jgi:ribosomal protein S18 acetylase RimI-like enzyme